MKNHLNTLCTLFLIIACSVFSVAQNESYSPTDPIPTDPSVKIGVLENGMKYYIKKNAKPENRVELRMALNAGAMQEDEDQLGLAHFIEHMCFNGSANFKKNELVDYLESVGTKFGPDLNAYTSFDETVYMIQTRTDDEEILSKGLLILEDWAGAVSFDHEEIDKERGVVISEWRSRLSPDQRMQQKYFPIQYYNSRYAERLPIGKPEIIENADYEVFKRYYRDWYRPNLMALSIVGDIDVEKMEQEIVTRFSKLKNPDNPRPRKSYDVPKHKETFISINSDKEASFSNVRLMYKHDHIPVKTIEDYRGSIVRSLYNRMLNARLDELKQSPTPPFTFAYSGYGRDVGNIDTYEGYAFVPEGGTLTGLKTLLTENKRALNHGFNASELERQKTEMLKYAKKSVKESDKTESRRLVMRYVYNFLKGNAIPSPEQTLTLYEQFLPSINIEEVNQLAKNWITDENRVIVITGPEKEETPMPTEADVLAVLKEVEDGEVTPYTDNVSDEPLFSKTLSPVKISEEKMMDEIGVTEMVLANGVKVIFKPTDFKNDEILMSAYSPGGTSLYNDTDYPSASNAARVINESGLASFDEVQLGKKLTGKVVSASPYIGELWEGFNGSASPDDLETMMQLIHLYFTSPRKDEKALQSYIAKQKAIYSNLMSNPQYWFFNQLSEIKYGGHLRRGFPSAEDLDKINLDKVFEIYQDRFADAGDFTFCFVGNFELDMIKDLSSKYLGNLPTLNRKESWKDINADLLDGKIEKNLSKGQAPKSLIDITFHGDFEHTPENKYNLNALIQVLRIKMRESMREDKGGVYGVRVSGGASQFPKSGYSINISFNSDPENVEDLIKTAMNDIENARKIGAEEKDLEKVTETQRQEKVKNLKENRYWSRQLLNAYREGNDPNKIQMKYLEEAIEGLTAEDIKNAANKYFDENKMIKVVMNPAEEETN